MKKNYKHTLCLLALSAALLTLVGCQGGTQPTTPTPGVSSSSAQETEPVQKNSQFKAGTWLATGGEVEEFYFFDADGASGRTASLEDGTGIAFTYEALDGKTVFHMGDSEIDLPCNVVVTDEEHITMEWEAQYTQVMTYCSPLGSGAFCFYTNQELAQLALRDYEGRNGLTGSGLTAAAANDEDGTVTIQLYQELSGHNSTAAWYQVDRCTARGTDISSGEAVDLSTSPVELRIGLAPEDMRPGEYLEYIADDSEYQTRVILTARTGLKDFALVSLEPSDEAGTFRFRATGELYTLEALTPEQPLVVALELPETLPRLGVRYMDGAGAEKLCAFGESGMDGAPLLIEAEEVK